ncbi:hypothetical protein ACOMHN_008709 [Nucella lapillus]
MSELLLGDCPEGFYKCQSGLCIPSFLLNNGETDCWDGDDEDIPMHNMTCPGYYRCQDNGICIPLPITRHQFTGQNYAFSIFIILNFIIFLFIAVGQVLIYGAIQQARAAARSGHRGKDLTIARRLLLIVLTDFCCWFPIGAMGLLAQGGVPIPGRVNVWAAIFVMPLNSALNPFMYTLNELINQWKKRRMEKRVKRMLCKLEMDIPKWDAANISKLVKICVQCKVVQKDTMIKWMGIRSDTQSPSSSLGEAMVTDLDPI